jgi:mRNA interferase MazF
MSRALKIGDVIEITFPRRVPKGHEQEGKRPAIVIGIPEKLDQPRHPLVITIPVTTSSGDWSAKNKLYLSLKKGEGNLLDNSIILTDQVISVDASRIKGLFGTLREERINQIKSIIGQIFEINN